MTATMDMTAARNILTKVALGEKLDEKETFVLQAQFGKMEDKDAPSTLDKLEQMDKEMEELEKWWDSFPTEYDRLCRKVVMCNAKHTWKGHIRDKAKAGYHHGAARMGWGHYDRWLKPETISKDLKKDMLAQLNEVNNTSYNLEEIKDKLGWIFNQDIYGMNMVFYHHAADFALLDGWNAKIRLWTEKMLENMPSEGDVYSYVEDAYPEMGMSEMKNLVEGFLGKWKLDILMEAGSMWRYCQKAHLSYRGEIQFNLILAYNKLSNLTRKVKQAKAGELGGFMDKFGVIMFEIVNLKHKLEEMGKANAKFI